MLRPVEQTERVEKTARYQKGIAMRTTKKQRLLAEREHDLACFRLNLQYLASIATAPYASKEGIQAESLVIFDWRFV